MRSYLVDAVVHGVSLLLKLVVKLCKYLLVAMLSLST